MVMVFHSPLENAHNKLTQLKQAIKEVLDMHQSYTHTYTRNTSSGQQDIDIEYCAICVNDNEQHVMWPCATYTKLSIALKAK